jgi:3-hydroxyacyl-CoA dehydrogenase
MSYEIKKAAVLGAGVMGAAIAAHLTNAGIECVLLDIIPFELTEDDRQKGQICRKRSCRNIEIQARQLLYQEERNHDQNGKL